MRKTLYASKKSVSYTDWWKHARPFGKRLVNKSERKGFKIGASKNSETG